MAAIEPTRIRPLWAEHYPKWRQSPASKDVCLTISRAIKEQAALLTAGSNWSIKLGVTLASYSIPRTSSPSSSKTGLNTQENR
jgi:hypothetical protein